MYFLTSLSSFTCKLKKEKKKSSLTFRNISQVIMSLTVPCWKNHTSPLTLLFLFCYTNYSVLVCPIGQTLSKNHSRGLKNGKEVRFFLISIQIQDAVEVD